MEAFAAAGGAGAAIAIELVDGEHAVSAVAALGEGGAALRPAAKLRVSPGPEIHLRVLGIVGGLGFWEAWRLPQVCRELRFGFSGGGAPADMIKLGLERRGVWARLREARAAERDEEGRTRLLNACGTRVDDAQRVCEVIELGWPGSVEARDI